MPMTATVRWADDALFLADSGSGHVVAMDGAAELGGRNRAPRPMEMLLIGMGGCTAYDVVLILKRMRERVTDCQVALEAERADDDPKVFTAIRCHYTVSGVGLDRAKVDRAVALSVEKYRSATIMLAKTATIAHDVTVVETA